MLQSLVLYVTDSYLQVSYNIYAILERKLLCQSNTLPSLRQIIIVWPHRVSQSQALMVNTLRMSLTPCFVTCLHDTGMVSTSLFTQYEHVCSTIHIKLLHPFIYHSFGSSYSNQTWS